MAALYQRRSIKEEPVVLITGCSAGGIGYHLCVAFQDAGCRVIATARRLESMAGLRERGQQLPGPLAELSMEEVKTLYDVNVFGLLRMTQAVFGGMAVRGHGTIVNIASVVGAVCTPLSGAYCSSKAAVLSASDALRMELKPFGIKVVTVRQEEEEKVLPGAVSSHIAANTGGKLSSLRLRFFAPLRAAVEERVNASQGAKSTPTDVFAKQVVAAVLQPSPPARLWLGHLSALFRLFSWLPVWATDALFSKRFGITAVEMLLTVQAASLGAAGAEEGACAAPPSKSSKSS